MAKIKFRSIKLSKANKERLETINEIIEEYQEQGYKLTLRQLYYQLVSRDIIPNLLPEYAKLSNLLKEGRMGGIVDWDAIEDRLRQPSVPGSWDSPKDILKSALYAYEKPRMKGQNTYLEVWVEKDALSGVLKRVTEKYHIPIVVNRGYSSATAMFDAYERFVYADNKGQREKKILYLGDFDPSGVDMIRDINTRIVEFIKGRYGNPIDDDYQIASEYGFSVLPIALTLEQIRLYNPPPNPAKQTDPRAKDFIKTHGSTSWEVDALRPEVLNSILEKVILDNIDLELYESIIYQEEAEKDKLRQFIENF